MKETAGLPEPRRMPDGLRDRLWAEIEPQLRTQAPAGRYKSIRAPLAVAASVVVLAVGVVIALPQFRGHDDAGIAGAGSPEEARLVKECAEADHDERLLPAGQWRPGARIDLDAEISLLVIRNQNEAYICTIDHGTAKGLMDSDNTRASYDALSEARPVDYLIPWNYREVPALSVHFGIATSDVTAVSVVGPDDSATPAILRDGTFLAKTGFFITSRQPTASGQPTHSSQPVSTHVLATLKNGHLIQRRPH